MATLQELAPEARTRLERELEPGEKVFWAGQPRPGRHALRALPIALFGVPWTAFAVFWTVMASGIGGQAHEFGWLFGLFGLPFVAIGIAMLGSPWWARRRAMATVYAITERRALILSGTRTLRTESHASEQFVEIHKTERSDGSGDLLFLERTVRGRRGRVRSVPDGFWGVPDVRDAERFLRALRST